MTGERPVAGDSMWRAGGRIPDCPEGDGGDAAAFVLSGPEPSRIPVLIAVPHAGRAYPQTLFDRMREPDVMAPRLEDRHADRLARKIAEATGAVLLVAHAPRAMIDLNRAPDDIDWDMIEDEAGRDERAAALRRSPSSLAARRARTGLGLIPRRLPGHGELWKRRHSRADLEARVASIHEPYHACLGTVLAGLRARWGAALLIDLHSMPPLAAQAGAEPARIVVGDRFGASCDGRLVAASFAFLAEHGHSSAHNRPYAGGYVLERHGQPRAGVHALQLEIDRASYLDRSLAEPGDGFTETAAMLAALIAHLAGTTAELASSNPEYRGFGRGWAEAAE